MNVYLSAKQKNPIRGDWIVEMVLRYDIAPIPRTLELSVQDVDGLGAKLVEGASLWAGPEGLEYMIVDVNRDSSSAMVQGKRQMAVFKVSAYLASCVSIGYRRRTAVVKEGKSLGECFRACGATIAIGNDFAVSRFTCLKGFIPSFEIVRLLQEESAALVLRKGALSVTRLQDIFQQTPVANLPMDTSESCGSEFKARHEIPSFLSVDDSGAFIEGNFTVARAVGYAPRQTTRSLYNMTRCLVVRRKVKTDIAMNIVAGDCITIAGTNYAIVTRVDSYRQQNVGTTQTESVLYAAVLST
jgi:hypothetical protein